MAEPLRRSLEEEHIETASLDVVAPLPPALPGTPPAEIHEGPFVVENEPPSTTERVSGAARGAIDSVKSSLRSGIDVVSSKSRDAGEALGDMAESAQEKAKELSEDARIRFDEFRRSAYHRMRQAKGAARKAADEHPLETILAIGGAALVIGFLLRVWRSNNE
jgi:ElaB/YqjD/DUF883 family membrane-anchored ribosome-binding protein